MSVASDRDGGPVRSIAVIGDGVAAWAAAAAFTRRLPGVTVTVVMPVEPAVQLVDLVGTAAPSAADFHADLGLPERDLLAAAGGIFRLGARYRDWTPGGDYLLCHGQHGTTLAGAAFHHHWHRLRDTAGPFTAYSLAASLAAAGRFLPQAPAGLPQMGYGYTFNPAAYAAVLRDVSRAAVCRVRLEHDRSNRAGRSTQPHGRRAAGHCAVSGADGRITHLVLADSNLLEADLYVDTTGAVADLVSSAWDDWSGWLPVKHLSATRTPLPHAAAAALPLVDTVTATPGGWTLVAAEQHATVTITATTGPQDAETIMIAPGVRRSPWTGNVVAIGDAAVALEPLDGVALHLVHAHVDRIVALMPGRDFAAVEIDDYNRQTRDEASRLRDFAVLRYAAGGRDEPVWRNRDPAELPDSLAHDVRLWHSRGHLPIHDGETFTPDAWHSVLIGQGFVPRRIDPVAAEVPLATATRELAVMRAAVTAAVHAAPAHATYLHHILEEPR